MDINVLFIGDVVGKPGIRALFVQLKQIIKNTKSDFIIVNGENASEGKGITATEVNALFSFDVDVITTGNHIWQKKDIFSQEFTVQKAETDNIIISTIGKMCFTADAFLFKTYFFEKPYGTFICCICFECNAMNIQFVKQPFQNAV